MNMIILVYTFRSFPYIKELEEIFPYVFIVGSLKNDLSALYGFIMREKPDLILGVAASSDSKSYFESRTVNRFTKMGRVVMKGKEELALFIPEWSTFNVSTKISTDFCNYIMYSIESYIEHKKLSTRVSFCHVAKNDIATLSKFKNN